MKAALKEEQGKSQSMGMVVKYLENAKEALEREKQALIQKKSTEVSFSIGLTFMNLDGGVVGQITYPG